MREGLHKSSASFSATTVGELGGPTSFVTQHQVCGGRPSSNGGIQCPITIGILLRHGTPDSLSLQRT